MAALPDTPRAPPYVGAIVLVRHPAGTDPIPAIVVGLRMNPYLVDVRLIAGAGAEQAVPMKLLRGHPPLSSEHPWGWSWPLENLVTVDGKYVRYETLVERGLLPPKMT